MYKNKKHIAVVVSPLRSLMADQVKQCQDLKVDACWYQPESTKEEIQGTSECRPRVASCLINVLLNYKT